MSSSDVVDSTAENRQAWQRFSEAWAKRDIDALMALVTDDIVYGASVGPEPGATFRGCDEVRRGFEHMLRHDQVLREPAGPEVIVGDHGFAEWAYDVRLGRRDRWMRARGRRLGVRKRSVGPERRVPQG